MTGKIIIPGGTGFLGRTLAKWYRDRDVEVVVLSRNLRSIANARVVEWDAKSLGPWTAELEGARAVVNLAGRSVNCRYTAANRRVMMDSRIDSTRVLGQAVAACEAPPPVWINSSTATLYKHRYDAANTESAGKIGATPEAKDAFSVEIARAWEEAFFAAEAPRTRKVAIRTAMVMGTEPGGVFEMLWRLTKLGLGGTMGDGRQYVSWLHSVDFCRAVDWLLGNEDADGVYNLTAPHPLPNREMMKLFRSTAGAPFGLPATRWMLEVGAFLMRTETELIIKSRRVEPERLEKEGFRFQYPDLEGALADLRQRSEGSGIQAERSS